MKKNNFNKGFTLIELMITVAIVAILTSVALPSYQDSVRKARRADAYDALLNCAAAQARNYSTASPPTYLNQAGVIANNLCGIAAGGALTSKEGHYTLTVVNANCTQNGGLWCFTVTATATGSQAQDTDCATFTIDHTGDQTATPDTGGNCWRS